MSKKTQRITFYSLSILLLILIGSFGFFHNSKQIARAQTSGTPLTGFAWSSNLGWIHFNPTFGGVVMDEAGNLSGYAWANPRDDAGTNNIGWLSFNVNDIASCPSAPCQPSVNLSTGAVTGWAKFMAPVTQSSNAGGWDGWVRLSGPNFSSPQANGTGGATLSAPDKNSIRTFVGYSWGADKTGWIHWSGSNYAVTIGGLSVACGPNLAVVEPNVIVTWTANPNEGSGNYSYSWSGSGGLTGKTQSVTKSYPAVGNYNATVVVTDLTSGKIGTCIGFVNVETQPAPVITKYQSTGVGGSCSPGIDLAWTGSAGATGYRLYKRTGSTGLFAPGDILSGTTYRDSNITPGQGYYYYVTALNGKEESAASAIAGPVIYTIPKACLNVVPAEVTLIAVPATVPDGGRCTLNYSVSSLADCTISSQGDTKFTPNPLTFSSPAGGVSDSVTTSPIHKTQSYTLDCVNGTSEHKRATASCDLSPKFKEF